jgi:hypothetical protein
MQGDIKPDHIPLNKYKFLVLGLPPLVCTKVGGLDDELMTVELPDQTVASGGNHKPGDFTITMPEHHRLEQAAMEAWFVEATEPVSPTYKKSATLVCSSNSGAIISTKSLLGVFPKKRTTQDREMDNEGELATIEWTLSFDKVMPL